MICIKNYFLIVVPARAFLIESTKVLAGLNAGIKCSGISIATPFLINTCTCRAMNEIVVEDGDVLVRELGALRRLTLNRPKALNALTLGMSETMTRHMQTWAGDPAVGAILIDGSGDRAFCAGGDLRALYDGAKAGNSVAAQFWSTEYKLDVLIARYPKPVVVIVWPRLPNT